MPGQRNAARNVVKRKVGFQSDEMAVRHIGVVARDYAAGKSSIGFREFAGRYGEIDIRPGYAESAARIPAKSMIGRTLRDSLRARQR